MQTKQKAHITATVGTAIFLLLLFLLLWFVYLGAPQMPEDPGIEVAFGEVEEGGGYQPEPVEPTPQEAIPAPTVATQPSSQELLTQEDEESLALQRQREKEEKARKAEAERLRKQEAEARAKAEAEARAKAEAEAKAKAERDAKIAKANAMGGLFGNNGSDATGSGDSQGSGQKGNPIGHGSVGGNSWSLAGRDLKGMPQPSNNFSQEGTVVVRIEVNRQGQVVAATLGTGSTISDKATVQLALDAARRATFSEGSQDKQVGTITYHFKFK